MDEISARRGLRLNILTLGIVVAIAIAATDFLGGGMSPQDRLAMSDNDAITRFISVRDWLAGQGWYDMTLHRVAPPEGVSLHWSRYVDLGLAAIIWPASLVASMQTAEAIGLVLWPALLLLTMIVLSAKAAARLFGPVAGAIAALAVVAWPTTRGSYFGPGRIDHHNVQILLLFVVILSLIGTGNGARRGLIGALAAALSLAIGLENLAPLGVAGLVLFWRQWRDPGAAGFQLGAFALSMFLGAIVFFAGQTPASEWMIAHCDELAPPMLALTGIAAGVAVAATVAARLIQRRVVRGGVFIALGLAGAALAVPLLASCAAGPYGELSAELQATIVTRILEAQPAHIFALDGSPVFFSNVLPAVFTVLIATILWLRSATTPSSARDAAGIFLIFGWIGIAGSFFQLRMLVLAAPAVPVLAGYLLSTLLDARKARRESLGAALALIGAAGATLLLPSISLGLIIALTSVPDPAEATTTFSTDTCRTPDILRSLDALPPSRILTYLNLGPPILLTTHHSVLAAPYHRSAAALGNGILPFEADRDGLMSAIDSSGAEYLVLCRADIHVPNIPYAIELASGATDARLIPVEGMDEALVILKVQP